MAQISHTAECPRALVIALGDLGRSPRMMNHARALRARGWSVTVAGYGHNPPPPDLSVDPAVEVTCLDDGGAGYLQVLWRLTRELRRERWAAVVVQNPPGFPVMLLLGLAGRRGARRVLDWHNFGGSLLALRDSKRRHAAGLYHWLEQQAAGMADEHWAVSAALAERLEGLGAVVVYDRPARVFQTAARSLLRGQPGSEGRQGDADRQTWWRRVLPNQPPPAAPCWVVAPSSWGPDEDSDAMLRVAENWRSNAAGWGSAPKIAIIATGKGPMQSDFARKAAAAAAGPVALTTAWVPAAEYPALLAWADAGLCLHRSSSGVDLPMKLADFRGAGRKALVLDYGPVLGEVFRPEADGWTFRDDAGLAEGLRRLAMLTAEELSLAADTEDTWEVEWNRQLGAWASAFEAGRGRG